MVSDFSENLDLITSLSDLEQSVSDQEGEQLLRFHLVPNTTVVLPIAQISEVLKVTQESIMPIPHLADWVMGVYNWRGEILWMVDLGHLLGLTPWYQGENTTTTLITIVLDQAIQANKSNKTEKRSVGLVVKRVEELEWCNPDLLESLPAANIAPKLRSFLRGYWLKSNGEMLLALESKVILQTIAQQ